MKADDAGLIAPSIFSRTTFCEKIAVGRTIMKMKRMTKR
jgi:hypothetical protein